MKKSILAAFLGAGLAVSAGAFALISLPQPLHNLPSVGDVTPSPYLSQLDTQNYNFKDANKIYSSDQAIGTDGSTITCTGNCMFTITGTVLVRAKIIVADGATLNIRLGTSGNLTNGQEEYAILKRADKNLDAMFEVQAGGTLNIRPSNDYNENKNRQIYIDGGANWALTNSDGTGLAKTLSNAGLTATGPLIDVATGGGKQARFYAVSVTLQNAYSKDSAAAIQTHSLTDGVTFDQSQNQVTMRDCRIQNCATESDNSVIYLANVAATFQNCSFLNNACNGKWGGVMRGVGESYVKLTLKEGCLAENNYSSGWGGFLLWNSYQDNPDGSESKGTLHSEATISDCTFSNNTARYLGGAIHCQSIMTIENTTISGNSAMSGGGLNIMPTSKTGVENAIELTLGPGNTISGNHSMATEAFTTHFDTNTYPAGGGGISLIIHQNTTNASLTVSNGTTIESNNAAAIGGGIAVLTFPNVEYSSALVIDGTTITGNAACYGGGIYADCSELTLTSGSVQNNTASSTAQGMNIFYAGCNTINHTFSTTSPIVGTIDDPGMVVPLGSAKVTIHVSIDNVTYTLELSPAKNGLYQYIIAETNDASNATLAAYKLNLPNFPASTESEKSFLCWKQVHDGDTDYIVCKPGTAVNLVNKDVLVAVQVTPVHLTINLNNAPAGRFFLFHVKGSAQDVDFEFDVVLDNTHSNVTIENLPQGEYTVSLADGWNWRYDTLTQTKSSGSYTFTFDLSTATNKDTWLDCESSSDALTATAPAAAQYALLPSEDKKKLV